MMAQAYIRNADDLHVEIARLRLLRDEQQLAIKARFSSPRTTLATLYSVFFKPGHNILTHDFFSILSRVLLPITLNKTLFRHSNFLVKGLVGYLSQKASHYVTEDSVTGLWDKLKSLFDQKKPKHVDYGIPPESEAS